VTPERYRQVKNLFQLVLDQPPADRRTYLERACGSDTELFTQVRELLKADYKSEDFLEKPAVTPISKVLAEAAADMQETMPGKIGPYAIQKLLGSGGMGAVYLASRADKSYDKQVAIKVIHKGMQSDKILQRFRRERQIVASLDHPNIARLLDGGATDDGRPYIVMEYVEGQAIDTWCDQKRLTTEKRLQLFLQVCDAIHYAHQNLIIHRDIKPGNILVRPDNTVKLLDFGIAKLINPEVGSAVPDKTATSMRLMTPQYASPEQVKGDPVTTATDVYLLGIVLYELLTGHRPYQIRDQGALEAIRAFALGEPQKPSEAIFRTADHALPDGRRQITKNVVSVSQVRDGNPAALLQALQGDIDAILLRALRRNPSDRYQSTAQLAEDIRCHLNHLPISALPDNPAYRVRLFLRRNLLATVAAATAVTLLIVVTIFAIWQAYRARTEHLRAEARFAEVFKISNASLFDVQETLAPLPGTTPARRLLVQKTVLYLGNLSKDTALDATLKKEIANGYLRLGAIQANPNLGDLHGALTSYQTAQSLAPDQPGPREAIAEILTANGNPVGPIPYLRRAAGLRESTNDAPGLRASTYHKLAAALAYNGSTDEALQLSHKAHQIALALTGPQAPRQQARSYTQLASVLQQTGNVPAATEAFRTALQLNEHLAAANPLAPEPKRELAAAIENLAGAETPAAAAPLFHRSLQLRRELAAADNHNTETRRELAYALLKQGSVEDALESFRQIIQLDPANTLARQDLAYAWENQGNAQSKAGKSEAALNSYQQLLQSVREWTQRDPANPYAIRLLAVAQMQLAGIRPNPDAIGNVKGAIGILDGLLEKDRDNPLFRHDRAHAQWTLGRVLSNLAEKSKQTSEWKSAAKELQHARQLYAALPLTGEERQAPQKIDTQIQACRQAGGF
jgi:serine/threonine protein kinase/Tfp pilus assembly protein PilF